MAASQPGLNVRFEVVHTIYDESHPGVAANFGVGGQENLRNRVSSILYFENQPDATYSNYFNASHYTYDVSGNVPKILQEDRGVVANPFKQIEYDFDLYSGKVNTVWYNRGMQDQFAHHFRYDANNRIISAETSNDGEIWDVDAQSFYYHHGPLARLELGEKRVQGVDYAYTLSGWIKAVNSGSLAGNRDLGSDGFASNNNTANQSFAKDAFGYNLFYAGSADYSPIRGNSNFLYNNNIGNTSTPLYNGNISRMVVDLPEFPLAASANSSMVLSDFNYDVLNRIVASRSSVAEVADNAAAANSFNGISVLNDMSLSTNYWYDANGNIDSLNRYTLNGTLMDNFHYAYDPHGLDNKLISVREDATFNSVSHHDIRPGQPDINYFYDEIGNLIHDEQEQIEEIKWTVSGKVKMITWKDNIKPRIEYIYDAMGNRIQKRIYSAGNERPPVITRYVRDAQGNTMAVYTETYEGQDATQVMNELHLYGASRLGLKKTNVSYVQNYNADYYNDRFFNLNLGWIASFEYCPTTFPQGNSELTTAYSFNRLLGDKVYELSDHLGNTHVTLTDGKYAADQQSFWMPTISSFTDYYPFGMEIAERTWSMGDYRYGYNGKENDDEVKGSGNSVDFGARIYDSRLCRFLSVDPLIMKYSHYSPYIFAGNKPIWKVDFEGLSEASIVQNSTIKHVYQENYNSYQNPDLEEKDRRGVDIISERIVKTYVVSDENGRQMFTMSFVVVVSVKIDENGNCSKPYVSRDDIIVTYPEGGNGYIAQKSGTIDLSATSADFQAEVKKTADFKKKNKGLSPIQQVAIVNANYNKAKNALAAESAIVDIAAAAVLAVNFAVSQINLEEDPRKIKHVVRKKKSYTEKDGVCKSPL